MSLDTGSPGRPVRVSSVFVYIGIGERVQRAQVSSGDSSSQNPELNPDPVLVIVIIPC